MKYIFYISYKPKESSVVRSEEDTFASSSSDDAGGNIKGASGRQSLDS
jgi:hypothetical protein